MVDVAHRDARSVAAPLTAIAAALLMLWLIIGNQVDLMTQLERAAGRATSPRVRSLAQGFGFIAGVLHVTLWWMYALAIAALARLPLLSVSALLGVRRVAWVIGVAQVPLVAWAGYVHLLLNGAAPRAEDAAALTALLTTIAFWRLVAYVAAFVWLVVGLTRTFRLRARTALALAGTPLFLFVLVDVLFAGVATALRSR